MKDFKVGDICEVISDCVWIGKKVEILLIRDYFLIIVRLIDGLKNPLYFRKDELKLFKQTKQIFSDIDPYGEENWEN